jgi:hypothetical protein
LISASWSGELVIVSTSQDWASDCIQFPVSDPACTDQRMR